jgi:hypothetical protein
MKFAQPVPARILLEEDLTALETLPRILTHYGTMREGKPEILDDLTQTAFLRMAKTINERVQERTIDYSGERYVIMAKGRRRLRLGQKREPDLFIGSDYGTNFIDACHSYFMFHSRRNKLMRKALHIMAGRYSDYLPKI